MAAINEAIDLAGLHRRSTTKSAGTLALELARLDELQEVFYQPALEGDAQCGRLVTKLTSGAA